MHHTVLDVVKMNPLLKAQITNAVGAVCGMVEMGGGTEFTFDKPVVAITGFGFGEMAVQTAMGMLEEADFVPIVCHAQGKGDKAMEEMIADGAFDGVMDICIGGVIENIFDGNRDPGPDRLMAAINRGIPTVLAPCGLDMLSYGGREDKLEQLNQAEGPYTFLIPLKGWSSLDLEGRQNYDPEADAAFVERLKEKINNPDAIKLVDLHLYTPEFAKVAVDEFISLYKQAKD